MPEVRCCCKPENLVGLLPEGLPFETRELDDGSFAYVAHSLPEDLLAQAKKRKMPGKKKTWKEPRKTWKTKRAPHPKGGRR